MPVCLEPVYFGYELKADWSATNRHQARTPDAGWVLADRLIVIDHPEDTTYLVALSTADTESARQAGMWLTRTEATLAVLPPAEPQPPGTGAWDGDVGRWLVRPESDYLADVAECQRQLRAGESYEICLTNRLQLPSGPDLLTDYRRLRRINPAPYAAYLRFGDLTVACSSSERFLRVDRNSLSQPSAACCRPG